MDINGKTTLFVKEFNGVRVFTASISKKQEDGTYVSAPIRVRFSKDEGRDKALAELDVKKAYQLEISKGWLDVNCFTKKDGTNVKEVILFVKEAHLLSSKEIKNNIPF